MPGPWRRQFIATDRPSSIHFNLRRDARPLATTSLNALLCPYSTFQSQTRCQAPGDAGILLVVSAIECHFNLRRDARPLATAMIYRTRTAPHIFQSQTRCQAPGDCGAPRLACKED